VPRIELRQQRRIERQLRLQIMRDVAAAAAHLEIAADEILAAREVDVCRDLAAEEGERMQLPVEIADRRIVVGEPAAGAIPRGTGDLRARDSGRNETLHP